MIVYTRKRKDIHTMNVSDKILRKDEKAVFNLRELYELHGYKRFRMSKFEEYDLYVENKNFLVSENILSFHDLNGKLMALKPDVTLSIVKNIKEDSEGAQKLYYNENVYRTATGAHEFKEIMQVGLEYIGNIDTYSMCEVISLASESLAKISDRYILDISHMGFVSGLLSEIDFPYGAKDEMVTYIGEKNPHEIKRLCARLGISDELCASIVKMSSLYGPFEDTLSSAKELVMNADMESAVKELEAVYSVLSETADASKFRLDFSIVNDMSYYNGIIFQGFVEGIPASVLSGGRYDNLLRKLGKNKDAVGFAVYLDLLERYDMQTKEYDVDVLYVYDSSADAATVAKTVKEITRNGKSVIAQSSANTDIKYKEIVFANERE